MRISVQRSGGFAGLMKRAEIDAATLKAAERAEVEALVAAARATPLPPAAAIPDAYVYEVVIDGDRHELGETEMPREWEQLVEWMLERAAGGGRV